VETGRELTDSLTAELDKAITDYKDAHQSSYELNN